MNDIIESLPDDTSRSQFEIDAQLDDKETRDLLRGRSNDLDQAEATLEDLSQFIGRAGYPWALLRKAHEGEMKSIRRKQRRTS